MEQLTAPVGVSLKNILVATDFSVPSVSALACVVPIAQASDSVVHILHVIPPPEIAIASPEAETDISEQRQLDAHGTAAPFRKIRLAVWLAQSGASRRAVLPEVGSVRAMPLPPYSDKSITKGM
jgi:nucleotide-binding universal stress UspA family protein